ncbi:hypothetical protein TcasGA2_TC007245 [Tribolium castaneum]|uniref:Uncharacterized protein n=1 Tax=Tribolium castaneum TaxID=7070 RepID=D2A0K1_TRICA|nr:hypothetical protein TcasGA2_TC007245 [Tribolium castaneum]
MIRSFDSRHIVNSQPSAIFNCTPLLPLTIFRRRRTMFSAVITPHFSALFSQTSARSHHYISVPAENPPKNNPLIYIQTDDLRNSSEIQRVLKQAKWRLLMKLFLRLSELFHLIRTNRAAIGPERARDADRPPHWRKPPGKHDVTQRS